MKQQLTKQHFFNQPRKVLIIGYGRIGKLLSKILLENSNASVIALSRKKHRSTNNRLKIISSWEKIPATDLIIPCVPISSFEGIIKKIATNIKSPGICMDICSVKVHPAKVMEKYLPKHFNIIASHPMFGPDSYRINKGLKDLKLILNNIRATKKDYLSLKNFFQSLGLNILEFTPTKHDKYMANSLGYSYLIGKINNLVGIKQTPIDTYNFSLLLENTQIVENDSDQLFLDMQLYNPYAKTVRNKFLTVSNKLIKKLNNLRSDLT